MFDHYKDTYGGDIFDELGLLFVEKEGYRRFRYKYWKPMQQLMLKNFAERVYNWCEENGVQLTGHYVEETTLGMQLMCCGGAMPFYEYMHIPGIDWLGRESDNEISIRQVSSAAVQLGKNQVISETFACCGWDISPRDLLRIAGFQYVNGVNLMCQHLIPYAEHGNRKRDYPAHYSPHNPWVKEFFKEFSDYFTDLGSLLVNGKESVNVAMLHPIRSAYFGYKREKESSAFGIMELEERFSEACRMLSSANVAYHFLDETLLEKHGFVDDGQIGCANCKYDYLVLPHIVTMDKTTEKLIHKYVRNGGKLLIFGDKPTYLEGEPYEYTYLVSNCSIEEIIDAQPYSVSNHSIEIHSTCRTIDGLRFVFVQNASSTDSYHQTFHFDDSIQLFIRLNLVDREMQQVPLTVELEPGEAALLFPDCASPQLQEELKCVDLHFKDALVSFENNALIIDYVSCSTNGTIFSEPMPYTALFQHLLEQRYKGKIWFRYEFEVAEEASEMFIKVEKGTAINLRLNDKGLSFQDVEPHEHDFMMAGISSLINVGINQYTCEVDWYQSEDVYFTLFGENVTESMKNCLVYDSELEPIYVLGRFGVYPKGGYTDSEDMGFILAKDFYIGRIPETVSEPTSDGFPFFSGRLTLSQPITFSQKEVCLRVLGSYHIAEVKVNGQAAGTIISDNRLDVSKHVKEGENLIEVSFIIGNRNLLGPHHYTGPKGSVSPFVFELNGTWENGRSPNYRDRYELLKLYDEKL